MATALATKPPPPHQKMKRPPPPAVQTGLNGERSTQPSPSPSLGSMRAPSASKQPPSATNSSGVNGTMNGTGPRSSTRRRDPKFGKPGQDGDRRVQKKVSEPYVKTTSYIMRKYKKHPPSVILHLHPTHFRFDQQDGTFSYNSPMRFLLEHIKNETVPHDMMEELIAGGVKFYEGCLIVQIVDHRTAAAALGSKTNPVNDKKLPFSIHNHDEHLTPSPYIPHPESNNSATDDKDTKGELTTSTTTGASKGQVSSESSAQGTSTKDSVCKFTTVLFPTALSLQAEVAYYATTPDPRSVNRKQSTAGNVPRTPASATIPHPPTPLSAAPLTPSTAGPPNKKQKTLVGAKDIRNFESRLVEAVAGPLCLDPVDNLQEAQILINSLTDPQHKEEYPAPKTRKRTVAELAADEALAAQEQRFMLIMDERLAPLASGAAAGKASVADGETGAAGFEPRFERFKLIEQIKAEQYAKKKREREQKEQREAMQAAAKAKNDKENEARLAREQHLAQEARQAQERQAQIEGIQLKPNQTQATLMAMREQHRRQQAAAQNQTSQPPVSNSVMPSSQPHMVPASQAHQSPIVRNTTPHNASSPPLSHVGHSATSQPINVTSAGPAITGSPARPPSAMQHGHPQAGGVAMVHQRSQQGQSRRSTPMQAGTPNMPQATPVLGTSTPVSRMAHGSPPNTMAQTPVMAPNTIAAQHIGMGNHQMTPEQYRRVQQRQEQQKIAVAQHQRANFEQQQQIAHQLQTSPGAQLSPDRIQLIQQQQHQRLAQQQQAYQENVRKQQHQQMNGHIPSPYPGQPPQPHAGQPQHPGQPRIHPGQPRPMPAQYMQQQMSQLQRTAYDARLRYISQTLGGEIPLDKQGQAHAAAMAYAQSATRQAMAKQHQQQEMEHQRRLMMQAQMGGMAGVNGMGGGMQMGVGGAAGQIPNGGGMGGVNMNGMNGMGMNGMGMQ